MRHWDRTVWTNAAARATWEPRLRRIGAAWGQIERASVAEGLRAACLQSALPEGLAALSEWAARQGLVALALGPELRPFSDGAVASEVHAGKRWNDRIVILRPELSVPWLRAWRSGEEQAIADWLGVPACCGAFWRRVSAFGRDLDAIWHMSEGALAVDDRSRRVDAPAVECNILLRGLGVRLVPHVPCSFACEASVRLGGTLAEVGARYGHADEIAWAREMLSWPMEWSAAAGLARIKTTVFQISAPTEPRPGRYTVRLTAARARRRGVPWAARRGRFVEDQSSPACSSEASPSGSFAPGLTTNVEPKRG